MSKYYYSFERGQVKQFSKALLDDEDDKHNDQTLKHIFLGKENIEFPSFGDYEIQIPCAKACEEHSHILSNGQSYVKGEVKSLFAVVLLMQLERILYFVGKP